MQVQYATVKLPSIDCNRIADRLCERLGYGKNAWTELPLNMCCNLTNSSNEWTLTNEKMWHCDCGSGVRRNHESCDDGNLNVRLPWLSLVIVTTRKKMLCALLDTKEETLRLA